MYLVSPNLYFVNTTLTRRRPSRSAGVILFFLVAGSQLFDILGPGCFYFFQKINLHQRGYTNFLTLARDAEGVPKNFGLWEFFHVHARGKFQPSRALKKLLNQIFDLNPQTRLTIDQVLTHDWLRFEDTAKDLAAFNDDMRSRMSKSRRDRVFVLGSLHDITEALSYLEKHLPQPADLQLALDGVIMRQSSSSASEDEDLVKDGSSSAGSCPMEDDSGWVSRDKDCLLVGSPTHFLIKVSLPSDGGEVVAVAHWLKGTLGQWLNFILGIILHQRGLWVISCVSSLFLNPSAASQLRPGRRVN